MSENIGAMLKSARLAKGWLTSEIAKDIGISAQHLEKLEENLFHEIGAPVFVRGYVNLYARHLGIDEQHIKEALNHFTFGQAPNLKLNPANIESQAKSFKTNYLGAWLSMFALLSGIVVLSWQILNKDSWLLQQINQAFGTPAPTTTQQPVLLETQPPAVTPPLVLESSPPTAVPPLAPLNNNQPAPSEGGQSLALESLSNNPEENTETPTEETVAVEPSVKIEFTKSAQITLTNNQKKKISTGTKKSGHVVELKPEEAPFNLNISNPSAIRLFINGNEVELKQFHSKGKNYLIKLEDETNE